MNHKLFVQAITRLAAGLLLFAALLFLPAGTLLYPNGWLLTALLFIPLTTAGIVLLLKSPELLAKRLNAKEKMGSQRTVVALSGLMFLAGFISAGLDFRFGWTNFPCWAVAAASALFLTAYVLYAEVLRENAYLSRTIEVQENQKVIDTGLYGIVRHPMYAATILLFLSMPLVLGSAISLVCFLPYPILIAQRIRSEERLLEEHLPGYAEYKTRVCWKILPYIW